jgi:hypothetical protein
LSKLLSFFVVLFAGQILIAQPITGVYHGKVVKKRFGINKVFKLELKMVQKGDSLVGTSYYYSSKNHYYRYSIKGYKDLNTGTIHWWDEELLENRGPKVKVNLPNGDALICSADVNCPGSGQINFDGEATPIKDEEANKNKYDLQAEKISGSKFKDEWDDLIENYNYGYAGLKDIDSVQKIFAINKTKIPSNTIINEEEEEEQEIRDTIQIIREPAKGQVTVTPVDIPAITKPKENPTQENAKIPATKIEEPKDTSTLIEPLVNNPFYKGNQINNPPVVTKPEIKTDTALLKNPLTSEPVEKEITQTKEEPKPKLITEPLPTKPAMEVTVKNTVDTIRKITKPVKPDDTKLVTRKKQFVQTINFTTDSLQIQLFDNAEEDGDLVSIYLNNTLIEKNVLLKSKPYFIKLNKEILKDENELVMVAENLGEIPPNTALCLINVQGKQYRITLESTENSSAGIKLTRSK